MSAHTHTRSSALPYIDPMCRGHFSERFHSLMGHVRVELPYARRSHLRIKVASIDDWGFGRFEGSGHACISGTPGTARLVDHALLLLPLNGDNRSLQKPSIVAAPGNIILSDWPTADVVVSDGDFCYLCVYIPRPQLLAAGDGKVPYGNVLDARAGPGAVLAATMTAVIDQAMQGHDLKALSRLLPDFLHLTLSSFVAGNRLFGQATPLPPRFIRIARFLDEHFRDPRLKPAVVAQACGLSLRQLFREFENQDTSFETQLRHLRLRHAKKLLLSKPHQSVAEVAFMSGFSGAAVFGRCFRKQYGLTPRQYRVGDPG